MGDPGDEPIDLLFVCTANICRSAFADVLARRLLGDDPRVRVGSAGIHGFVDHPMDEPMAEQARSRGADPAPFRSRRLSLDLVDAADLVLTADTSHRAWLLDERPGAFRRVFTLGQFARLVDRLPADARGRALLDAARRGAGRAETSDDVADPYRRGPEAAAAAADHLDRLLGSVLPRLTPAA